jgi:hypothetical protein
LITFGARPGAAEDGSQGDKEIRGQGDPLWKQHLDGAQR